MAVLLQPHIVRVVISNLDKTRAVAEAKVKSYKVDARILAQLLAADFLPGTWRDKRTRMLWRLSMRRAQLVRGCIQGQESGLGRTAISVRTRECASPAGNRPPRADHQGRIAVIHKLASAIWHVLNDRVPYGGLGADYLAKRDPERASRRMIKEASSLGLTIRFGPIEVTGPVQLTSSSFQSQLNRILGGGSRYPR